MGKALFFDIDGTLVNFQGKMPESAKHALLQVQKKGHLIVICSGRSICQIYPWLMDMKFDGIIAAAGAYVEYDHQAVCDYHMDKKTVALVCSLLDEAHALYSAQTRNRIIMTKDCKKSIDSKFRSMCVDRDVVEQVNKCVLIDEHLEQHQNIEKIIFFDSKIPIAILRQRLKECCDVTEISFNLPTESDGEISCKGINKAFGIQKFIEHAGIAREDTVAFGDGPNDFDMMAYAHVGVAMGNAIEDIKKQADYVTTGIDEDGIEHALQELGLL